VYSEVHLFMYAFIGPMVVPTVLNVRRL
jgi:hypothetical protein